MYSYANINILRLCRNTCVFFWVTYMRTVQNARPYMFHVCFVFAWSPLHTQTPCKTLCLICFMPVLCLHSLIYTHKHNTKHATAAVSCIFLCVHKPLPSPHTHVQPYHHNVSYKKGWPDITPHPCTEQGMPRGKIQTKPQWE